MPTEGSIRDVEAPPAPSSTLGSGPTALGSASPRFISSTSASSTGFGSGGVGGGSGAATPMMNTPSPAGSVMKQRGDWRNLDAFYASSESEEEEEEEEEGESGEGEEEELMGGGHGEEGDEEKKESEEEEEEEVPLRRHVRHVADSGTGAGEAQTRGKLDDFYDD